MKSKDQIIKAMEELGYETCAKEDNPEWSFNTGIHFRKKPEPKFPKTFGIYEVKDNIGGYDISIRNPVSGWMSEENIKDMEEAIAYWKEKKK